ncbi:MAG: glycerol-3-phosphate dehydrogenase [Candidatus Dormiibacterota bacterium]
MTTVAVLGAGVMASALTVPLSDNGHDVRLVGTHLDRDIIASVQESRLHPVLQHQLPGSVRAFQLEDAEAACAGADVVLSGVNSFGVHWAGQRLATLLRPGQLVVAIAKGLEAAPNGDLQILPEVLASEVPGPLRAQVSWSAIAGPSIAGEVAARRSTCVVFTGRDQPALERLATTFRTACYHVWTSTDLIGVEVCAAMKNCYAFGAGFAEGVLEATGEADGKDRNFNYTSALFAEASVEMARMVRLLGGLAETVAWLPGVGDLYVTSLAGRNVRVGRLVGRGMRFSEAQATMPGVTLEGIAAIGVIGDALPKLAKRGVIGGGDFPLLRRLHQVVADDAWPELPWGTFFGGEA